MSADWTWLVDMAGDNNLSPETITNMTLLAQANDKSVGVVVEVDKPQNATVRYALRKNVLEPVLTLTGNVDSGSPAALTDFLSWSKRTFPSKRYAVVLWGHGRGWLDFDPPDTAFVPVNTKAIKDFPLLRLRQFKDAGQLSTEAILLDTSSHHFLTNQQMADALTDALGRDGKFAIVGCDACLMAMIEVAHQCRDTSEVYVAAQDNEDPGGWPYDQILQGFTNGLAVETAASTIVTAARGAATPVRTLSAIRLAQVDALASALDHLGAALLPLMPGKMSAIAAARDQTRSFALFAAIDLRHFAMLLRAELATERAVAAALDVLIAVIDAAVIAPAPAAVTDNAFGISVYLPTVAFDAVGNGYSKLSLRQAAPNWGTFVERFAATR